jgi:GT2 family glycosyltransferase
MAIAALMACHDRREKTVACVRSLREAARTAGILGTMTLVAVDAGSLDGTAEALRSEWPGALVVTTGRDLHWAPSMALAEKTARREVSNFTHLLWMNDDSVLDPTAIETLINTLHGAQRAIAVGALRDDHGAISYSGIRFTSFWHPLRFERVTPLGVPTEVDSLNGNFVLIPLPAASELGCIDGEFVHGLADFDYGVRARKAGIRVVLAPGTVGVCPRNVEKPEPKRLIDRWRWIFDPKTRALPDHSRYLRRHSPLRWLPLVIAPFVQFVGRELRRLGSRP